MAVITAQMVRELRESTSAGMMDCKKALTESDGDMDAAVDWLRTKGLSKAAKKSGRIASEGLVGMAIDGTKGALVELNSETDFVSKNEEFQNFARELAALSLANDGNLEAIKTAKMESGKAVSEALTDLIAKIGENMNLRRASGLSVEHGVVAGYIHNAAADGLGRIAVLVGLESSGDESKLRELGRKIAMHVAATAPLSLCVDDLDAATVDKERAVFAEQARASGKPDNIIEKMVEGRLRKFYEDVVLLKQAFVMDPDKTVEATIEAAKSEVGAPVKLTGFVRMALGEGIEKKEEDFAAEVAATAGGH